MFDLKSSKNATKFGHISMSKNQSVLQNGRKEKSEQIGPYKHLPSYTVPPNRREDIVVDSNAQETSGV